MFLVLPIASSSVVKADRNLSCKIFTSFFPLNLNVAFIGYALYFVSEFAFCSPCNCKSFAWFLLVSVIFFQNLIVLSFWCYSIHFLLVYASYIFDHCCVFHIHSIMSPFSLDFANWSGNQSFDPYFPFDKKYVSQPLCIKKKKT